MGNYKQFRHLRKSVSVLTNIINKECLIPMFHKYNPSFQIVFTLGACQNSHYDL